MAILDPNELNMFFMTSEQFWNFALLCDWQSANFSVEDTYNVKDKKKPLVAKRLRSEGKVVPWAENDN